MSSPNQPEGSNTATQGGNEGLGHVPTGAPVETIGGFNSLRQQKAAAEHKYMSQAEDSAGTSLDAHQHEDTSFMNHKPGGSQTLPGWSKAKEMLNLASE